MSANSKKSGQKQHTISELLDMRDNLNALLLTLCPPCPECCPPRAPCEPGEIANHGTGDISICAHCWGRGYLEPNDEEDE
jgi:hypothetical protein